ncbi:MAG: RNA methyltransferase [Lachnospiraceae bacterium]|nr:RNA methyltransferase [Lachnospiraceae bacterium]
MLTNAKIKEIQKLTEKSKARREAGLFVIEGPRMFIETPLEWIEEIYVTQRFLDNADSGLLGMTEGSSVDGDSTSPISTSPATSVGSVENSHSDYSTSIRASEMITWMNHEVVTEEQMKKLTDTVTPQGILCVVRQPSYTMEDIINHPGHRLLMILEDIQDPGNLGTIFRTAEGAGASGIIMTKGCADLFNPKVVRSTMGSIYRVPFFVTDDIEQTISLVKNAQIEVFAAHLKGEHFYDEIEYKDAAFLIGNEGRGLKDSTASLADTYIKIPMSGELESLNASMAAGILMYEHNRQIRIGHR